MTRSFRRPHTLRASLLAIFFALFALSAFGQESIVRLDPAQTKINFTLDDVLHTVRGQFTLKEGEIHFNPTTGVASGALIIDARSGNSGNKSRDKKMHKEILESEKYPEIAFLPQHVTGTIPAHGASEVQVSGIFRIHGVDHPLTLAVPVQFSSSNMKATTTFDIPYVAWGMKDPSAFLLRVGKSARIDISATGQLSGK